MKFYNSVIFKVFPFSKLLEYECYITVYKSVFYRQHEIEVEPLTKLVIEEYFINLNKLGFFNYYKQWIKEYIACRKQKLSHADACNQISLTKEEYAKALERLPDPDLNEEFFS